MSAATTFDPETLAREAEEDFRFARDVDALLSHVTLRAALWTIPYKPQKCSRCGVNLPAGLPRAELRVTEGRRSHYSRYLCAADARASGVDFAPLAPERAWRVVRKLVGQTRSPAGIPPELRAWIAGVLEEVA